MRIAELIAREKDGVTVEVWIDERGRVSIVGSSDVRVHFPFTVLNDGGIRGEYPRLSEVPKHGGLSLHISASVCGLPIRVEVDRNFGAINRKPWFGLPPGLFVSTLPFEGIRVFACTGADFGGEAAQRYILLGSQPLAGESDK